MKDHEWNSTQISIRKNTSVYNFKQSFILEGMGFGAKKEGDFMISIFKPRSPARGDFYFKIVLCPSPLCGQMFAFLVKCLELGHSKQPGDWLAVSLPFQVSRPFEVSWPFEFYQPIQVSPGHSKFKSAIPSPSLRLPAV
jgi:hypothetical protein